MKYILINDIQRISKEIHMSKMTFFSCFHVMGNKEYKFRDFFGHATWNFLIICINSRLMN